MELIEFIKTISQDTKQNIIMCRKKLEVCLCGKIPEQSGQFSKCPGAIESHIICKKKELTTETVQGSLCRSCQELAKSMLGRIAEQMKSIGEEVGRAGGAEEKQDELMRRVSAIAGREIEATGERLKMLAEDGEELMRKIRELKQGDLGVVETRH